MKALDCYTHLPGVVIRGKEPVPFEQGRFLRLSYDAWRAARRLVYRE